MELSLYMKIPFLIQMLMHNQRLRPTEVRELQNKKLKALVEYSYKYVPYYHSLFAEKGLHPDDIKCVDDLDKIPILKKKDVRDSPLEEITAMNIDLNKCWMLRTSGTTGTPLSIYWEKEARLIRYLRDYIFQLNCGDRITNRRVILAGWMPDPPKSIQKIGLFKTKRISPFDDLETQIEQIRNFGPKTMITWPSCVTELCKEIEEKEIQGINLRLVFTGGELLDEHKRNIIRETFEADLFDSYGANEVGVISYECVEHAGYHVESDSIILEITKDGEVVSPGEEGEITVTNLDNRAMPFIRYNLEDLGILTNDECSCGNSFPLMKLTCGRKSDTIQLPSGRKVSAGRVYFDLNLIPGIRQFQVIQEKIDQLVVKIVKNSKFTEENYNEIMQIFRQRLGNLELDVLFVDNIQRDKSGKFKPFITRIPRECSESVDGALRTAQAPT